MTNRFQVKGLFRAPGNEQVTSLHGMMQDSGLFNVELQALERADWAANIWNNSGDFEGIAYGQNMGVRGDIDQYLSTRWSPARRLRDAVNVPGGVPLVREGPEPAQRTTYRI